MFDLAPKQIELLRKCTYGLDINSLSGDDMTTLLWLSREKKYCHPLGDKLESTVYVLTPAGAAYLSAEQKQADKVRQDAADKKTERKFQVINTLLGAVAGAVITLIIEHFDTIVTFIGASS